MKTKRLQQRICVQNLAAYNRGELIYKWIDLPTDEDELREQINEVIARGGGEEYHIPDWEGFPFELSEYMSPYKINEYAQILEESHVEFEVAEIIIKHVFGEHCIEDALECIQDQDFFSLPEISTDKELGYALADNGFVHLPENFNESFIDFEAIGREWRIDTPIIIRNGYAVWTAS
ncbi:MAG: antirestriction protein ArdA [bacterium]